MLELSKSRFYALIQAGIFPEAIRHESCKRPVFDLDLQQKCLDIRRTGIGANGQPVLFNRKNRQTASQQRKNKQTTSSEHQEIVEALKSLGLHTNGEAVDSALRELYPDGVMATDQGEIVRQVFLLLQKKK